MRLRLASGAAAMLLACIPAFATPVSINPGQTVTPGMGTFGGKLLDSLTHDGAEHTVSYMDSVYADPNNPLCVGCLDFVLQVQSSDLPTVVTSVRSADFAGDKYALMVAYAGSDVTSPSSATEGPGGDRVTFNTDITFFDPLFGGPDDLIIYTNAMAYTTGTITFTTTSLDIDPPGFAPSGPAMTGVTPEPASLWLLGTGAMGMAGVVRRRVTQVG